ncbi:response regulator [Pareuzebyella sediminis]|uniref:response regulator n=1 Tax=Pareuzebyella sediminis TaxID=2607998 RepID=UPI0011EFA19B|nr:response regulator [Pareuzebyella sediminis]
MSLKIIVVEDNFIIQMFLEEVAQNMGHEVLVSTDNGEDLLGLLDTMVSDVILLDIGITGKHSGIEIAEILNVKYKVPFVFVTGNSDHSTIKRAKDSSPLHIIHKPIDEEQLEEELETIEHKLSASKHLEKHR